MNLLGKRASNYSQKALKGAKLRKKLFLSPSPNKMAPLQLKEDLDDSDEVSSCLSNVEQPESVFS